MGPPEDCTRQPDRSDHCGGRKRSTRRPRTRPCLLKGCERRFRPMRATERYCRRECREAAGRWRRWKAQQRYRATAAGREKRNGQSRRYRARVRSRKQTTAEEALPEAGRVITPNFFRPLLRPARLLPGVLPAAAITSPEVLFQRLPTGRGTCPAARAPLASRPTAAVEQVSRHSGEISLTY
jgi:hypothetical protein